MCPCSSMAMLPQKKQTLCQHTGTPCNIRAHGCVWVIGDSLEAKEATIQPHKNIRPSSRCTCTEQHSKPPHPKRTLCQHTGMPCNTGAEVACGWMVTALIDQRLPFTPMRPSSINLCSQHCLKLSAALSTRCQPPLRTQLPVCHTHLLDTCTLD
jgi:hypothetical protein